MGLQLHFKGGSTIRILLVALKDKDNITQKSGVIYWYKFERLQCDEECIWESTRTFGERLKEHFGVPSLTYEHANTGDHTSFYNYFTVVKESHKLTRTIREAVHIRVSDP